MTISSSLNASVAGLSVNANRLATISDNIANSSTYGYRRSVAEFNSMVVTGGGRTYTAGGVSSINQRLIDQGGGLLSTNNSTDLAVQGRGFIPVASASQVETDGTPEMLLATTGSFRRNEDGFLINASGHYLLGWPADLEGNIPSFPRGSDSGLEPVRVTSSLVADPTTLIEVGLNLPATDTLDTGPGEDHTLVLNYFDDLGLSQELTATFTPTVPAPGDPASNTWTLNLTDSSQGGINVGEYTVTFEPSGANSGQIASIVTVSGGTYDGTTGIIPVGVNGATIDLDIGAVGETGGLTQFSDSFAPILLQTNGSSVGNVSAVEVDANGMVSAIYDNGSTRVIYQVPLADLPNPNGLLTLDNQTYQPSSTSGPFFLWDASDGPTGEIRSYMLEESSVDVAQELTNMIKTQRAYSSNAKVVQTVDEMLQETTNIKR